MSEANRIGRVIPQSPSRPPRRPNQPDRFRAARSHENSNGPIGRMAHPSVFYRVPMDVIGMAIEIFLVANQVFPKPSLPNAPLSARLAARRNMFAFLDCAGKTALDQIPAHGKIRIAFRQCHYAVQMFRQDYDRSNAVRMPLANRLERCTQRIQMIHEQAVSLAARKVHREEPACAGDVCAPIFGNWVACLNVAGYATDAVRASPHPTSFG